MTLSPMLFSGAGNPNCKNIPKLYKRVEKYTVEVTQDSFKTTDSLLQGGILKYALAISWEESRHRYFEINKYNYQGAYQMGTAAKQSVNVQGLTDFITSKQLQDAAFLAYTMRNKYVMRNYIRNYVGMTINNILITESGILAASHLRGAGRVREWLNSKGDIPEHRKIDGFGTSLEKYMKKISNIDTSRLPAARAVVVKKTYIVEAC